MSFSHGMAHRVVPNRCDHPSHTHSYTPTCTSYMVAAKNRVLQILVTHVEEVFRPELSGGKHGEGSCGEWKTRCESPGQASAQLCQHELIGLDQ